MKILNVKAGTSRWHDLREDPTVVTASEVPSIMGIEGAFESTLEVWARKTGRIKKDDAPSDPMIWGTRTEALNRQWTAEEIGSPILPSPGLVQHDELDWFLATPDGGYFLTDQGDTLVPCWEDVEALWEGKAPSFNLAAWSERVPPVVVAQVQAQLAVCGLGIATASALIAPGVRYSTLEADPEFQEHMIHRLEEFREYVRQDRQPPADAGDLDIIKKLLPPMAPSTVAEAPELEPDAEELAALKEEIKALESKKDAIMARIWGAIGDAQYLTAGPYIFKRGESEIPERTVAGYTRRELRAVKKIK